MSSNTGLPSTSTPKANKDTMKPGASPKQSPVVGVGSKLPQIPVGAKGPGPVNASKLKVSDKQDSKRRREEVSSSGEGSAVAVSLMDTSEITIKHDALKQMINGAVQDAIKAAMTVVSTRLEASLKNIFTEQFDRLESRVFDTEQKIDNEIKKATESLKSHKTETSKKLTDHEQRIYANERGVSENENYVYNMELNVNDLEQYTRRNSIRIHGMPEFRRENIFQRVSDYFYNELGEVQPDIEVAHRVGIKGQNPSVPRSIIVKFVRRSDKLEVMLRRKQLKGTGVSISDDLTTRNVRLIKEARDNERLESVWSWDGKVYAKGLNGHKFLLRPDTDVDSELNIANKGQ